MIVKKFRDSVLWKKISYSGLYQRIRFPEHYNAENKEYHFFLNLLGNNNQLMFDIGANTGEKAAIFKKLSKKVVCFEPSPNSINTLRSRFAYSNVIIEPIAISNKIATSQLYVVDGIETLNSINSKQLKEVIRPVAKDKIISTIEVPTKTLDVAIQNFGKPEYIKIDVEGNEKEVVTGLSFPVKFLSFENCTPNFLEEGITSIEHLCRISNEKALFNIYVNGTFLFQKFSDSEVIKDHLRDNNYGAAEIFCKSF